MNTLLVRVMRLEERMFIVSLPRRKHTLKFRKGAVRLVFKSERPIAHVAELFGVWATSI